MSEKYRPEGILFVNRAKKELPVSDVLDGLTNLKGVEVIYGVSERSGYVNPNRSQRVLMTDVVVNARSLSEVKRFAKRASNVSVTEGKEGLDVVALQQDGNTYNRVNIRVRRLGTGRK